MKKIAVVLSGCGFKDGAEITEAVSTLIALSEAGAEYKIFAPNLEFTATNHISDQTQEKRNILTEASRIARGEISELKNLSVNDFDGIVFPGGFGAALHLCTWAQDGSGCQVNEDIQHIITDFHKNAKPIAAICIAPALIAKVLGEHKINITIGNDKETAQEIEKTGAKHVECKVDDFITDRDAKIITTPAYMYEAKPHLVFKGISGAVNELVNMA